MSGMASQVLEGKEEPKTLLAFSCTVPSAPSLLDMHTSATRVARKETQTFRQSTKADLPVQAPTSQPPLLWRQVAAAAAAKRRRIMQYCGGRLKDAGTEKRAKGR